MRDRLRQDSRRAATLAPMKQFSRAPKNIRAVRERSTTPLPRIQILKLEKYCECCSGEKSFAAHLRFSWVIRVDFGCRPPIFGLRRATDIFVGATYASICRMEHRKRQRDRTVSCR